MTNKKEIEAVVEKNAAVEKKPAKAAYEPTYSIAELMAADLGAKPLTIKAALRMAGKLEYTLKEARKLVSDFKKEAGK